ncbi:MAG: hypothetical protein K8L99_15215 [Anaerolineae bacterium]|nr:hypothetical protein [Anaerolineae bacterium]
MRDPSAIRAKLEDEEGNETTYIYLTDVEITKISTGLYKFRFVPDKAGFWKYRWECTGATYAAGEHKVRLEKHIHVQTMRLLLGFGAGLIVGYCLVHRYIFDTTPRSR